MHHEVAIQPLQMFAHCGAGEREAVDDFLFGRAAADQMQNFTQARREAELRDVDGGGEASTDQRHNFAVQEFDQPALARACALSECTECQHVRCLAVIQLLRGIAETLKAAGLVRAAIGFVRVGTAE